MIPARWGPALFSLILSGMMSLLLAGVSTLRTVPLAQSGFLAHWMGAWLAGWLLAFPAVTLAAPLARRLVAWLTAQGGGGPPRA